MANFVERIRCTKSYPCPICGTTDFDMALRYDDGSVIYHCHKATGNSNIIVGGKEYVCIKADHMEELGRFNLYQEKSEKERIDAEKKRVWMQSPQFEEWKKRKGIQNFKPSFKKDTAVASAPTVVNFTKREVESLHPLSNKDLNDRYRFLLSKLVLEEKHERKLRAEWDSAIYPTIADDVLKKYPIRSFPPEDKIRFKGREQFQNPTRKQLMASLIKEFGDPRGIPGVYLREGEYWENKPMAERWTFSSQEGIIFPCYDIENNLYRSRLKVEYYNKTIKDHSFNGMNGTFYHKYSQDGNHLWYFDENGFGLDREPKKGILVYGGNHNLISLKDGVPEIGKATSKYKTISSYFEKNVGDKIVNGLSYGCTGGTPYSLYVPNNTNYKMIIGAEGEKKGIIASQIKGCPVLTNPGVGIYKQLFDRSNGKSVIDVLKERGMKMFVLCYDADKEVNPNVLASEKGFIDALKKEGIRVMKGDWSSSFDKGLDDILLQGVNFILNNP